MKYDEFQQIISASRMDRYFKACDYDSRKAMVLYRLNLRLSQELFTVISFFEVALRNAIDRFYTEKFGTDWLRAFAAKNGTFDNQYCVTTKKSINDAIIKLDSNYTHGKVVAELGFGFWRYLFSKHQYRVAGQTLIKVFPSLPKSNQVLKYNAKFIFNELAKINKIRNRIAHHEAVCFRPTLAVKCTTFARNHYNHNI